jgi:antitoxin (DNA-binding transcriptional repressor) of toxin-antitoxin stability system
VAFDAHEGLRKIQINAYSKEVCHMQIISATDLARNTREILDKVVSGGETMVVERNHIMVAQIVPPALTVTAAQALMGLTFPVLTQAQASAWLKDSKQNFDDVLRDPWA